MSVNLFGKLRLFMKCCVCFFSVTVVESGTRALQYLGLDGGNSSLGFNCGRTSININIIIIMNPLKGLMLLVSY